MASEFEPLLPRAGHRLATGGWKSAMFIIWVGVAERFAYYGISANLISYLTGPLGQSTANAAAAVNVWSGAASMLPVLGAVVADSWLGQYRTIVFSSVLYITFIFQMVHTIGVLPLIGINASDLCRFVDASESTQMNALSSMFPSPEGQQCNVSADGRQACPPSSLQTAFFYVSLYMVAIALSGHKPCLQAFGADQFDATDPKESLWQNSFFNWWYFGICGSATVTTAVMSYVQDNVSWGVGFGLPCVAMMLSLVVFLLGTSTYRLYDSRDGGGAAKLFSHAGQTLRAWMKRPPAEAEALVEHGDVPAENTVIVEELKSMARLFPIWATCLLYGVVYAQPSTLFTKQAATLDRRVDPSSSFQVPAAAMQCFKTISTITCVVLYDRVLVPAARRVSGVASGITMLQRIGAGMALAVITLVVAALVEMKRLSAATDAAGALAVVPMSVWWMVPQYVLLGMADAFTMVGMQEFFYDQMPSAFKSLGLGLYLSVLGVGSFISSFLISVIDGVTRRNGGTSWFADNLDRGHLDYFYLLVAALAALELLAFLYFSTSYVYKRKTVNVH